jgi:nitrate reductase beta subunit
MSRLTGKPINLKWGPNWEDDLAGLGETGAGDANFKNLEIQDLPAVSQRVHVLAAALV